MPSFMDLVTNALELFLRCVRLKGVAQTLTRGHNGSVSTLALDPTGTFIFSGNEHGECKVWMLTSGRLVLDTLLDQEAEKCSVACVCATGPIRVSPPGTSAMFFVAGSDHGTHELNSGILNCFKVSEEEIRSGKLAADAGLTASVFKMSRKIAPLKCIELIGTEKLAVCTEAGFIWIFSLADMVNGDYASSVCMSTLFFSSVLALLIHENRLLVAGSEVGRIAVWDLSMVKTRDIEFGTETGNPAIYTLSNAPSPTSQAASSPTNQPSSPSMSAALFGATAEVKSDPKKRLLKKMNARLGIAGTDDFTVTTLKKDYKRSNLPMCEYWAHGKRALQGGGINKFASMKNPSGDSLLFSASGDSTVKIWWLGKSDAVCTLRGHDAAVTDLVVNKMELYSASTDATVILWYVNRQAPEETCRVMTFRGHDSIITGMLIMPVPEDEEKAAGMGLEYYSNTPTRKKDRLLTSSRDGTVRMWHLPPVSEMGTPAETSGDSMFGDQKSIAAALPAMKGGQVIRSTTSSTTSLASHATYNLSGGIDDSNVVIGLSTGAMQYIDVFPTPQLQKEYRSASAFELINPLIDFTTYTYQKIIFVWPLLWAVIRLNIRRDSEDQYAQFDLGSQLEQATNTGLRVTLFAKMTRKGEGFVYYLELLVLVFCAAVVAIAMSCRVYQCTLNVIARKMREPEYIEESSSASSLQTLQRMKAHSRVMTLDSVRRGVWGFLWGSIKILTLPLLNHVYPILDCLHKKDGKLHLEIDTDTVCWEGTHLGFSITMSVIVLVYLIHAIPFTFCGCDAEVYYASRDWKDFLRHAHLQASKVDLAMMTPRGLDWCFNELTAMMVKATLPAITVLYNQNQALRCGLMTVVLLLECIVAVLMPAYRDWHFTDMVVALKLWTLGIFGAASYAGYRADRKEAAPGLGFWILVGSLAWIVLVQIKICATACLKSKNKVVTPCSDSKVYGEEAARLLAATESSEIEKMT